MIPLLVYYCLIIPAQVFSYREVSSRYSWKSNIFSTVIRKLMKLWKWKYVTRNNNGHDQSEKNLRWYSQSFYFQVMHFCGFNPIYDKKKQFLKIYHVAILSINHLHHLQFLAMISDSTPDCPSKNILQVVINRIKVDVLVDTGRA